MLALGQERESDARDIEQLLLQCLGGTGHSRIWSKLFDFGKQASDPRRWTGTGSERCQGLII